MSLSDNKKYEQDGDEAKEIAVYLPYFPFKGIPRFYDIGCFLYQPDVFQRIVDIFVDRYREIGVDVIAGYVQYCSWAAEKRFWSFHRRGWTSNL